MPAAPAFVGASTRRVTPRPGLFVVALGCAFCLLVLAATGWMVWEQRVHSIEKAGINLRNLALAVADQTDRVFASLELAENHLLEHIARRQLRGRGRPVKVRGESGISRDPE